MAGRRVSLQRLEEHRRLWARKPVLADVYAVWFEALLCSLQPGSHVLEAGAGPGFLSAYARRRRPDLRWVATDLVKASWNDVVADGLRLPFKSETADAVLALDLIHHLARPASFFAEAARVLKCGGHLAVIEPWVTPLSYPIYRWLHQEGCRLRLDPWDPFGVEEGAAKDAFQGDAGIVWRLVRDTKPQRWRELGFHPPRITVLNGFAYLLSLGFREGSLLPRALVPPFLRLDKATSAFARYSGMRVLAAWERESEVHPVSA